MVGDCSHVTRAGQLGDHRGSGGCCRAWVGTDGLRHQCRASRGAVMCRCPCGEVFQGQATTVPRRMGRRPKLTPDDADRVRVLYRNMSAAQLARRFNVSTGTINAVIERKGPYAEA